MTAPITILGTGHAGVTLARELRRLAPDAAIRLISKDDGHYYYKPDLSKAFAAGKDAEGLVKSTATQLAEQVKVDVRTGVCISRLAPGEHRLYAGEEVFEYSKLVLATGAEVIRLPLTGTAAAAVLSVNDRADYARFRAALKPQASVLIIGAGLIGCEFANDLAAAGYAVHVADIAHWPLPRLLPEAQGRAIQHGLASLGVRWHLGAAIASLDTDTGRVVASLNNGAKFTVDVVLSAVGLRPATRLATEAGIACNTGIVVNDLLQTSEPDVYALGDCVEIAGRLLPYILPIANASKALAATLAGSPTPARFPAMPVMVKTPACPTIVCPPPPVPGDWAVSGTAPDLEALFNTAEGKLVGFALTGAATARRGALAALMPAVHEPPMLHR